MSGPPPIPTTLKLLRGLPGKKKINKKDPSLRMKAEIPPMPGNLRDKEAREEWKRITKVLEGTGIVSKIDGKALALYCNTWSFYREAEKQVTKDGPVIYSANGNPVHHPAMTMLHSARKDLMKLLGEFGMTPSSRTKVQALPGGPTDELSDFLDG